MVYPVLKHCMASVLAASLAIAGVPADIRVSGNAADTVGTVVRSQGTSEKSAYIRGSGAKIVYDDSLDSNVLQLGGGNIGSGWLQLPDMFSDGCRGGFTFSLKFLIDSQAADYSRLFEFTTVPFGTGKAPSYSSPDISVDISDKSAFRASIFAGKGKETLDDNMHRAIFNIDAVPDTGKWHEMTMTCTPSGTAYYIDGEQIAYRSETADAASTSLFAEGLLDSYVYNSVGRSLYSDKDISARIDDVAFFSTALSGDQVGTLPLDKASYLYTFESGTVNAQPSLPAAESARALGGAQITSLPEYQTVSPDGRIITKLWKDGSGTYYYSVHKRSGTGFETVVEPSKLGIITTTEDLSTGFDSSGSAAVVSHDEKYRMPFGKHSTYHDNYTETSLPLIKGDTVMTVIIRNFNDGIGLRYSVDHGAAIKEEQTQVVFPDSGVYWGNWPNATYEWDMVEITSAKLTDAWADYSFPLTGKLSDTCWVTLSEANVFNEQDPYCAGCVSTTGGSRALKWKFGVKTSSVNMNSSFNTPWRAIAIGDDLNGMSNSELIMNLNPPSVIEDTSWIRPGKTAWSWWSSGGDSPIEYHTQKDYIDFAAENGWQFVCLDFGWALWDDSEEKVRELCQYASEKNIGIYLWYGVNNEGHSGYKDSKGNPAYPYYSLLDEATIVREFERIKALGVSGVKVDYYESDTQETMHQMHMCAEIAAQNKLMVLFHGCTLPRGESRTYPNVVSYEAINGSEYYKWFESPKLENRVSYTFTRNVAGSADFTPTGIPVYGIKATAGFALADVVTIESGIQHFAQSVYTYECSSALPFLNDVPVTWDELRVLDGYPMSFNVTARRHGDDWYIGASTIASRKVDIKLSDLISEGKWDAYIFADNSDGSDLEVTVKKGLTSGDVITRDLLPNGGFAIKLTQHGMKLTTPYSNYRSYEAENAKLSGRAVITSGKDGKYCSNDAYVGYVGGGAGNDVTFENIEAPEAGNYTLRIYYVSGEPRSLMVDVNGSYVKTLDGLYANRNDWSGIRAVNVEVKLNKGRNTVKLYNTSSYGPSIDRIALAIPETKLRGDVNADGQFGVADLVMLNNYVIGSKVLIDWHAGDLSEDGVIDIFDVLSIRRLLIS